MSQDRPSTSAILRARILRVLLSMHAEDVQEAGAEPEGLGSAEGSTDGAQLVRYVNPAQCVPSFERKIAIATRGSDSLITPDTVLGAT